MDEVDVDLTFFPYPTVNGVSRRQGFQEHWAKQCDTCDRRCGGSKEHGLSICSYGVNYQRLNNGLLVFGIFVKSPNPTSAAVKAIRRHDRPVLRRQDYDRVLKSLMSADQLVSKAVENRKREIIAAYVAEDRYKLDYLELMKPVIQKNLAFLHDYSQFVSSVKQNINVVLHERYPDGDMDAKLARATDAEGAIYWSSALMSEKLTTAFLLLHPERLAVGEKTTFKLHGLVLKYVKIYNAAFNNKQVRLEVTGYSVGLVRAVSSVLSVIPHTLLDNALKYSRAGSKVIVSFMETRSTIVLSVSSFGPKIDDDELDRIFEIFYRGRHAQEQEDGTGFGLHLAQFVATQLTTTIKVKQSSAPKQYGFETTFSVAFEREG